MSGSGRDDIAAISDAGAALSAALERTMMALCEMAVAASDTNDSAASAAQAVSELTGVHREISTRAAAAIDLTRQGVDRAQVSYATFTNLAAAVGKIQAFSAQIQRLAKQTHLIALNATIESARAGAAGRGFGVVASEVKRLADQTSQMSKQIFEEIGAVQQLTEHARASLGKVIEDVGAIDTEAGAIMHALALQQSLTTHLDENARRSADQMGKVTHEITEVQMTIAQTGDAYAQLTQSVDALAKGRAA